MMSVVVVVDQIDLKEGIKEEENVVGGGNRDNSHWYKVKRDIPYPIFITNLTLLL